MQAKSGGFGRRRVSRRPRPAVVAIAVTLALLAAACSDDDQSGSGFFSGIGEGTTTTTDGESPSDDPDPDPTDSGIDWVREGSIDRGTLDVPLDYDAPDGEQIDIAVSRRPAGTPDERLGVLLVNPGGPGSSGIEFASMAGLIFPREVLDHFDLIGFDPRGVGDSTDVRCGDGELMDRFTAADPVPPTPEVAAEVEAVIREFADACEADSGDLLPHINTEASARDMDRIREALGEEQITYIGFSYGTLLGATYAELFPERIRAFVLDGGYSRSLSAGALSEGQAVGFERSIDAFASWCTPEVCDLASGGEPGAEIVALLESIRSQPLATTDDDGRQLTVGLAWTGVIVAMYSPGFWPQLDRALVRARDQGDGSSLLALADLYNERGRDGEFGSIQYAFTAYNCMDRVPSTPAEDAAIAERLLDVAPRIGPVFVSTPSPCEFWPVEPRGTVEPFSSPDAPPMIVIATTGDPATPYEWGVLLADELETATLLTVEGDAHTAFGSGINCVDETVVAYLVDLEMPAEGARC